MRMMLHIKKLKKIKSYILYKLKNVFHHDQSIQGITVGLSTKSSSVLFLFFRICGADVSALHSDLKSCKEIKESRMYNDHISDKEVEKKEFRF